ncbi:hypothetical protein F5890DRAFT_1474154 [Lentinula detonsa]|uniref:Uncharacterized protein n=1 Tax=Lentinula detonsa TaxID=2804962 RepID=A0AA38UUL8_9AGAR|nr:hypothetical protein F5890DRAFT_1474154 [Lentinula detonsa]
MALSSAVKSLTDVAFSKKKDTTPALVPLTPNKKEFVDKRKEDDLNSDNIPSLSSSFPSFASFKGQRAFEHDRQRAKRTEDYIRTQEVKAFRTLSKPTPALSERQKKDVSTRKDRPIGSSVLDDEADLHSILEGVRNPIATKEPSTVQQNVEVKLVDLIKPGSIRKTRKNKDSEFELIPAVRPVIVLDEVAFMRDTPPPRDLEQEWQHIYHSDSDDSETSVPTPSPTYANVVIGI